MDIGVHKASLYVCTKEGSAWGCTEIRFEWHSVMCLDNEISVGEQAQNE